jgi:hypothetical protein
LFPDSPVREWDKLILRGDFGGSWLHQNGVDALTVSADTSQRPRGIRIREAFSKESFRDMGGAASHHRFCNLFINGVCWGSYELMEDEAEDFGASYFGGEKDDYDRWPSSRVPSPMRSMNSCAASSICRGFRTT